MARTLQEFEAICEELQSNPKNATKAIENFREKDYALEACHTWIRTPGCSSLAQFQLALVIQYSSLKNWAHLPAETVASLRDTLWGLIEGAVANGTMPTFALNKVILVFVLLWKRGWKDCTSKDQEILFSRLSNFLGTAQGNDPANSSVANPQAFKFGPLILRVMIEEFNSVNTTEIALPLEFHEKSHKKFESYGLGETLHLSLGCIGLGFNVISGLPEGALHSNFVNIVTESVKLLIELLQWNFASLSTKGDSKANLLYLPRAWARALVDSNLFEGAFSVYDKLRCGCLLLTSAPSKSGQQASAGQTGLIRKMDPEDAARQQTVRDIVGCLSELRSLLITLSSVSGSPFFENDDEKINFGDTLMGRTKALLESSLGSGGQEIQNNSPVGLLTEELRSSECESFSSIFLRLLGNYRLPLCYRMPSFGPMLMQLGQCTLQLTQEVSARLAVSIDKASNGHDWNDEVSIFQGWRGEALVLLFDAWCIILDDPVMLRSAHDHQYDNQWAHQAGGASMTTPQLQQLKTDMAQMARAVYKDLFECYYQSVVYEALIGAEDEEDEDEELIERRNRNDTLVCLGTIGRSSLVTSLDGVTAALQSAMQQLQALIDGTAGGYTEAKKLRILEMMRVVSLFGCHLFAEDFHSNAGETTSSEAVVLPQGVLDVGAAAANSILQLYSTVHACLLQHMSLANASPALLSPYLLQHLFGFMGEYYLRFFDPDRSLYYDMSDNPLLQLHGPEFDASVESLLACCKQVFLSMPLETELVQSVATLMINMSRTSLPQRLAFITGTASIQEIYQLLTDSDRFGACRLNEEGLANVFKALSWLAIKSKNEKMLVELCNYIYIMTRELTLIQAAGGKVTPDTQKKVTNLLACLRGLCATPSGLDKIIRDLFNSALPVVAWCAQQCAALRADDVTTSILLLLRDYSENKLMGLPQAYALILYRASKQVTHVMLTSLDFHANNPTYGGGEDEREEFRSATILSLLQLLNILASKDFFLDCEEDFDAAIVASGALNLATGQTSAQSEVCSVLLMGFQSIVPLLSAELLRTYPQTCDRYFSFVAFIVNSYMENLDDTLTGDLGLDNEPKTAFYLTLMQHLLWGAGAVDATAARLALKSIQAIADFYFVGLRSSRASSPSSNSIGGRVSTGNNIGPAAASTIFPLAITRLLEMIFFPYTCEYGIAQDRVDACGNALITLIALDFNRFQQCANTIVAQFAQEHPSAEQPLLSCFQKLTVDRGVSMTAIDKRNRQTFCLNFRDFIVAVRPVVKG